MTEARSDDRPERFVGTVAAPDHTRRTSRRPRRGTGRAGRGEARRACEDERRKLNGAIPAEESVSPEAAAPRSGGDYRTVPVGPFRLLDLSRRELAPAIAETAIAARGKKPTLAFACHVGGLNERRNREFVDAMQKADLAYADGVSVIALMRMAGARSVERHPTTDLGWEIFTALAGRLGRPVTVALLGGPEGLAAQAGEVMDTERHIDVVHTENGYHSEWGPVLDRLAEADPDVLVVGLGMPAEALWVAKHYDRLPNSLIVTCGGWFGYIVGEEKRAPEWMRKSGLEWVARIAQSPGRLWKRYATGALSTVAMVPTALRGRHEDSRSTQPGPGQGF
jgi:N-acetylglucosaminyldiphosphoundecaprenol N-acetyl-beta-D-mannosaminyltransferase